MFVWFPEFTWKRMLPSTGPYQPGRPGELRSPPIIFRSRYFSILCTTVAGPPNNSDLGKALINVSSKFEANSLMMVYPLSFLQEDVHSI